MSWYLSVAVARREPERSVSSIRLFIRVSPCGQKQLDCLNVVCATRSNQRSLATAANVMLTSQLNPIRHHLCIEENRLIYTSFTTWKIVMTEQRKRRVT